MKKLISIVLMIAVLVSLCACGKEMSFAAGDQIELGAWDFKLLAR